MIKAIFFDIDGTLISKKHPRIREDIKALFNKLRENGILLFVATGRHVSELEDLKINEDYHFDAYLTLNGCYCFNDHEVIHQAMISKDDVRKVLELLSNLDIACMFVEDKIMYINKINERVKVAQAAINTPLPDVKDISRAIDNNIYQIIPYINDSEIGIFIDVTNHCKGTRWNELAYDIIPKDGGKESGIKKVLSYYNLKVEETMAFGDGNNDIEMLKFVGIGVAMGNGATKTKEVSNFVTNNVDDDGIEYALKHFKVI